jgi:uncharacterized small protein (TIGR04563 family)
MPDDHKHQKQSLYFPQDMHDEMQAEANRLERSMSWVVVHAWKLAREKIKSLPTEETKQYPKFP